MIISLYVVKTQNTPVIIFWPIISQELDKTNWFINNGQSILLYSI